MSVVQQASLFTLRPPRRVLAKRLQTRPFARLGVGLTLARIPLGALGLCLLITTQNVAACLTFFAFAVVDVLDGAAARRGLVDNAPRRLSDVLIDRTFIHLAALSCVALHGRGLLLAALFIARDLAQASFSAYLLRSYRAVVIGARWHMFYGLSMLVWGCWFIVTGDVSMLLSAGALAIAFATLIDYVVRSMRLMPPTKI
jgi:phosphatidylglycerophosphate synthase